MRCNQANIIQLNCKWKMLKNAQKCSKFLLTESRLMLLSVLKSSLYHTNHVAITVYGVQENTNASTWMQDIFKAWKNVCIFYQNQKAAEMKGSAPRHRHFKGKSLTFIALFLTIGSVLFAVVELVGLRRAWPSSDV